MRASHVLNINSGTVCPRTSACDDHPMILRPIDEETAVAIMTGKVKASDVIEALTKAEMSSEDFDWREYDRKRRAAEEKYNVSKREMIPVSEDVQDDEKKDDENIVSLRDLGLGGKDEKKEQKTDAKSDRKKDEGDKAGSSTSDLDGVF